MIPKIIHYCWFGKNKKPELVEKCILSWKKCCPDWAIVEWNESNFDVSRIPFMHEAYEQKKWAFVSDVARLLILYQNGGVYLDTDVELLVDNPFDKYLKYTNILAFENERCINTGGFFGTEKESRLCTDLLNSYINIHYSKEQEIVNTQMNKPILVAKFPTLKWNGKEQEMKDTLFIGVKEYGKLMKHYGIRSWCDNLPEYTLSKDNKIKKILRNPIIFEKMEKTRIGKKIAKMYEFMVYDFLDMGVCYYLKRIWLKRR